MTSLKVVTFLLSVQISICAKFPSTFTKCDRKSAAFKKCLTESVENAIKQLNGPIREVGLVSLEPLKVPSLVIGAGSGAVGLEQNYKNINVFGFTKTKCSEIEMNFEKNTMTMECSAPEIQMEFEYNVSGKILMLPVYGNGPGSIILENVSYLLTIDLEEYKKKGTKHYKVIGNKLIMDPELIKYNFENLFDGDKALGDNINRVLNDNWKEVFLDVKSSYETAFGQIFSSVFNNFLSKVSISEMFDNN